MRPSLIRLRTPALSALVLLLPAALGAALVARAQGPAQQAPDHTVACQAGLCQTAHAEAASLPDDPATGVVTGTVISRDGSVYEGVHVSLKPATSSHNPPAALETTTDSSGAYRFPAIPPGPFEITFTAGGFTSETRSGDVSPGNTYALPAVILTVSSSSQVEVTASREEIATEQLHMEEEQRVLGVIPNFYVVYAPNAVALSSKQKFHLFWRTQIDPITFAASAVTAGVQQANDDFSGYGQGVKGYFKRFGSNYADSFIGNAIGGAILPSLLKQDPRYFYLGDGTIRHRALYAIANAIICKGDNGRWQFNYSGIGGSLAAGGISNLYYPASDRNGVGLTFENTGLGIAGSAVGNLFQEFVVPKLTPHLPKYGNQKPTP